jgi:molybdate transport system permease protein
MPLETFLALETDPDRAVLLSLLLVAISFAVLYALRGRWVEALLRGARP